MNLKAVALVGGLLVIVAAAPAAAQQPKIINAQLEQRSAAAGLVRTVDALLASAAQPAWTGYAVPAVSRANWETGNDGRSCTLQLEGHNYGSSSTSTGNAEPAGPRAVFVLYRLDGKQIDRVRAVSDDCQVDAGGLPLFWLSVSNPNRPRAWPSQNAASFLTAVGR
jgi:hypothetical protein